MDSSGNTEQDKRDFPEIHEIGWKKIHRDVFRPPVHCSLFCSLIGGGTHLLCILLCLIGLGGFNWYYGVRGGVMSAGIVLYGVTAGVSGVVSSALYKYLGGQRWALNILFCTIIFAGPLFVIWFMLNSIAVFYRSTSALPFYNVFTIFLWWLGVSLPLTVIGGLTGRGYITSTVQDKLKGNIPREIPKLQWNRKLWFTGLVNGFLTFSAIYIELHFVFQSIWGHQVFTLYGVFFLAFFLLLLVTAASAISLTYFQLSAENHRWWWKALLSAGSICLYVYVYSAWFYYYRSEMYGFLQFSWFFGYMALAGYALFLVLGTVGFASSFLLVKYIYSHIKFD